MLFLIPLALCFVGLPLLLIHPTCPQIFGEAYSHVKVNERVVALTFDDGPIPGFTDDVLAVLNKHNIHATFFLIGERAEKNPDLVKKIYTAGHELGNHTWSHALMLFKSPQFTREQIEKTDAVLRKLGYNKEIYFRSPYGQKLLILPWVLSEMHKKNILFDAYGWDWDSPGTDKIVENVMDKVSPGSIILLHDGCGTREQTVAAADTIIQQLKAQGSRLSVCNRNRAACHEQRDERRLLINSERK
jgi:peptidoglycan/xylan/chitin deacetylase (PgdA/CDA1 family)